MGRPVSFDRDQIVEDVTALFWRQGYLATSVADLVATTGLNPGSLYNAFDNKQGLLIAALDHYGHQSIQWVSNAMQQQGDIELAVQGFFDMLLDAMAGDPDAKGCFLVNCWLETAAHDVEVKDHISGMLDSIERVFFEAFQQAQKRQQIKADADPRVLAKFIMMSLCGLRVMSRMNPERSQLSAVVDQAMIVIKAALTESEYESAL